MNGSPNVLSYFHMVVFKDFFLRYLNSVKHVCLFIMFIDLKLSLFSGFFWLLSLLVSSILWYAVVPLREQLVFGLVFSVLFQEAFRFLFYKLLR